MKTREEIEKIKEDWLNDPQSDLTEIDDVKEYEYELLYFMMMHESKAELDRVLKRLREVEKKSKEGKEFRTACKVLKEIFSGKA